MRHLALGAGREFDRIRALVHSLGGQAEGLGDDCAILPPGPGHIVLSTDLSIEGVHFRREWLEAEEVGWRAAAAALSDLAAEGAEVLGVLASIGVPSGAPEDELNRLMQGVGGVVAQAGGKVLGGDLSRAPVWTADIAAVGRTERPVMRSGARVGDRLWVTGSLGAARAALCSWLAGEAPTPTARAAFSRPSPRIIAGQWLANHGARAMIDLSDGLAGDAGHLAAASGVRLEIPIDDLPVAGDVDAAARRLGISPEEFAAVGGEDYELLAALPPQFGPEEAGEFTDASGLPLTAIGGVVAGEGVRLTRRGQPVSLRGFDHLA